MYYIEQTVELHWSNCNCREPIVDVDLNCCPNLLSEALEVEVTLRLTVSQYVLVSSPLWDLRPDLTSCRKVAVLFLWGAQSDERTRLQFVVQSLNVPSHAEPVTILYTLI
jgi:hypothetical protein